LFTAYTRRLTKTMSRLSVINKIYWCWHFVVRIMRDTQTPPLSVITIVRRSSSHRLQSQILVEIRKSRFLPLLGVPLWNIARTLGMEMLDWCGYPTAKRIWRYGYSFRQTARAWQTAGRTDTAWWHRPRLCIASRGKRHDVAHKQSKSKQNVADSESWYCFQRVCLFRGQTKQKVVTDTCLVAFIIVFARSGTRLAGRIGSELRSTG